MKQTHLIFAFTIALVASSASAGLWDSIKKVGGDAVSTTVGIATSAADAAVKASTEKAAEKAAEATEEASDATAKATEKVTEKTQIAAPSVPASTTSAVAVQPAAPATTVVQPTAPAAAPRSSRRAGMRAATTDSAAEREAYYAAERKKREAARREEERKQAEFKAKREAYYAAEKKKREEAQREEERKQAEFKAKRKAEYEAAAKRQAEIREERRRQEAEAAARQKAEREARQKKMEEERRAAQEKAEREAREARERAARERFEKAFAFHQKAHAEAAGNADGYVYKPVVFWDGVKLAMTEEEAYAAFTNAHPSVSSWQTNSVPNGAKWIDGTVRTVALSNGRLNLMFAAGEARGLRLLVGANAVFANATNTANATNVAASADVCGRFAKLENVSADKTRAAIDWTWKDGVNDFWRSLHDEIARKLESAGEKSLKRLSHDRDTIRAEFMDATYEVTDKFTVDGVEIRVVSAEANGAVRLVTVNDVALNKAFGIPENLALADVNANDSAANDGASATDHAATNDRAAARNRAAVANDRAAARDRAAANARAAANDGAAANAAATKGSATANDGVSSGGETDKPANEASPISDRRRARRGR